MLAEAAAYLDHAEASRCAFAPKTESICRKLGLQNRKAGRGGENERLIQNEAERVFRLVVVVVVTLTLTLTLTLALALTSYPDSNQVQQLRHVHRHGRHLAGQPRAL